MRLLNLYLKIPTSAGNFRYHKVMKQLLLTTLLSFTAIADDIKPFTTDGCSLFPDGSIENNKKWMECCIRHDYAYWKGGTREQRKTADTELKHCVAELGEKDLSWIMHIGVRLGGDAYFPTWYRWGYGWPYLRGYEALTQEEQAQAKQRFIQFTDLLNTLSQDQQ